MHRLRRCRDAEGPSVAAVINAAAEAYRGVIPANCWHEPYMPRHELEREIAAGVTFWGAYSVNELMGVMGIQRVLDVDLIRHAYVLPVHQRHGVGGALLQHLRQTSTRRMLVGTWAAANWAIDFYRRHRFEPARDSEREPLLRKYWRLSSRQLEASVVLVSEAPQ